MFIYIYSVLSLYGSSPQSCRHAILVRAFSTILTPRVDWTRIPALEAHSHLHACLAAAMVTEVADPSSTLAGDTNPHWTLHAQNLHETNRWIQFWLWPCLQKWGSPPWCLVYDRCVATTRAGTTKNTFAVAVWALAHWIGYAGGGWHDCVCSLGGFFDL
jgi:hypothetical protein